MHSFRSDRETEPEPAPQPALAPSEAIQRAPESLLIGAYRANPPPFPSASAPTRIHRSATGAVAAPQPQRDAVSRIQRGAEANRQIIRRTELTSANTTIALTTIPIINTKLAEATAQGPTIAENVKAQLALFDEHLARKSSAGQVINEAMRIATIIDATAASISMSLGDPTLKGRIATELVAAYRADLTQALGSDTDTAERTAQTDKVVNIAATIVGDDPLTLYMNDKVLAPDAAWRIRAMADQAGLLPGEMYDTLEQRLMMQLGSFSINQVKAGERKKDDITSIDAHGAAKSGQASFVLKDLIGELSPSQFNATVAVDRSADNALSTPPPWVDDRLALTAKATAKLAALSKQVRSFNLKRTTLTPAQLQAERAMSGTGLNAKQSEHFHRLREEELAAAADYEAKGVSPRAFCIAKLVARYGLDSGAAGTIVNDIVAALLNVPLTLTNDLQKLFGARADGADLPTHGSVYKSEPARMQQEVDIGAAIGKPDHDAKAMAMGSPDPGFTKSRGANYMRWRRDEDERETGYHGLSADDLPTFGAVNPNFNDTKGGNAKLAQWNTTRTSSTESRTERTTTATSTSS